MEFSFKTKIIIISAIVLMWFVFGTIMIFRGAMDISKLKTIEGKLESYKVVTILGDKRNIEVLTFNVSGYADRTALYLNSREDYNPLIEKFNSNDNIKITYNDNGGVGADGYNLHIYQIEFGDKTLIHYDKITSTDKKVGMILYFVGLVFGLPIIYLYRQKEQKAAGNR